jgi:hypothetical protein
VLPGINKNLLSVGQRCDGQAGRHMIFDSENVYEGTLSDTAKLKLRIVGVRRKEDKTYVNIPNAFGFSASEAKIVDTHLTLPEDTRAFWEIYKGSGVLSREAMQYVTVLPLGLPEQDFRNKQHVATMIAKHASDMPPTLWAAPDCSTFCQITRMCKYTPAQEMARQKPFLDMLANLLPIFQAQVRWGFLFIEGPAFQKMWGTRICQHIIKTCGLKPYRFLQCPFGQVAPKLTTVYTNAPPQSMAHLVAAQCKCISHGTLLGSDRLGSRSRRAGIYTKELCAAFMIAVMYCHKIVMSRRNDNRKH